MLNIRVGTCLLHHTGRKVVVIIKLNVKIAKYFNFNGGD